METAKHKSLYIRSMILLAVVGAAVYIVLFSLTYFLFQPRPAHARTCADFDSYADILKDFHNGNSGLDGDNDGVPCENRK